MSPDNITTVLQTPRLEPWQLDLLQHAGVRYVVSSARTDSVDPIASMFFSPPVTHERDYFPLAVTTKFERAGVSRIFDSGDITIDDISGLQTKNLAK